MPARGHCREVSEPRLTIRTIPLRLLNGRVTRAHVIGRCATWHCACGNPIALQGRSGPASGPSADTVTVCDRCSRIYFVIPMDRAQSPPIEVVELFALPAPQAAPEPNAAPAPQNG
jgi:hypothetical protein